MNFKLLFIACAALLVGARAYAHLADRPDLNAWAHGLKNDTGMWCCDGADAKPILDPDWEGMPDGRYRVRVDGEWYMVPMASVIPGPNKYGRALLWGYPISLGGEKATFAIRCFMPGAGL